MIPINGKTGTSNSSGSSPPQTGPTIDTHYLTKLATGTFLNRIQRPSARLTKLWVIARQKFHPLVSIVHNDSKTGDKLTEIITTTVALVGLFVTAAQFTAAARARKAADFWGDQIEKTASLRSEEDETISDHYQNALSLVYAVERVPGWKFALPVGSLCFLTLWLFATSVLFKGFILSPVSAEGQLVAFTGVYALAATFGIFATLQKLLTLQVHRTKTKIGFKVEEFYDPALFEVRLFKHVKKCLALATAGILLASFAVACFSGFPVLTQNNDEILAAGFLSSIIAAITLWFSIHKFTSIYRNPLDENNLVVTLKAH